MYSLFQASEVLTSNMLYQHIMQLFDQSIHPQDAILLVPTAEDPGTLVVVDGIGNLPSSFRYTQLKEELDRLPQQSSNMCLQNDLLANYQHLIKFQNSKNITLAYLLFSDPMGDQPPDLSQFSIQIAYLLSIKNAFDSLPGLEKMQSKLKYQLSFFASTINNIFEPYGLDLLVQLYMEIISEMFLLPAAITLQLEGEQFRPILAKGVNLQEYKEFIVQAQPFYKNWNLKNFPTLLSESSPEQLGEENYRILAVHASKIIVPLTVGGTVQYLIVCICRDHNPFDYQDKASLMALTHTLNHALEFSQVKDTLMANNRELDKKVYSLSAVYRAAELIFSKTDRYETLEMALDMLMELFQSSISSVVLQNIMDDKFELMMVKSAFQKEHLDYWFDPPATVPKGEHLIIDYRNNPEDREIFLNLFPTFAQIEEVLQPVLIAQLCNKDGYYGFITLSDRVTEQPYGKDEKELLGLLLNSITLAIENVRMSEQVKHKNLQLEQSLRNIYAIQDALNIIRAASSMEEFCQLLSSVLETETGVSRLVILSIQKGELQVLSGELELTYREREEIKRTRSAGLFKVSRQEDAVSCILLPLHHIDKIYGFLIIESFKDTIIEDGERMNTLSIIANIIGETFAALMEKSQVSSQGIMNYPQLILYRLQSEIDKLHELSMDANIMKFSYPLPEEVLLACQDWSEGFVLFPQTGVLISPLSPEEMIEKTSNYEFDYEFVQEGELLFIF